MVWSSVACRPCVVGFSTTEAPPCRSRPSFGLVADKQREAERHDSDSDETDERGQQFASLRSILSVVGSRL